MANDSTYPACFASSRRDCRLPTALTELGGLTWSTELGLAGANARPYLLLWGGGVVAVTGFGLALFAKDGERRWERRKSKVGPATAFGDRLYYVNRDLDLDAVEVGNKLAVDGAPLPGVADDRFQVTLLAPRSEDFVLTSFFDAPNPEPEDLGNEPKPMLSCRRGLYGKTIGAWGQDFHGFTDLPPLFVPALNRLLIGFGEPKVVDVNNGEETPGFRLPLDPCVDWSADPEGGLCLTGYDAEGKKAVVGLSASGEELWRWVDQDQDDRWVRGQPPIRGQGERVYALTEGRALAIERGELKWSFDGWSDSLRHGATTEGGTFSVTSDGVLLSTEKLRHGTSLSDGSLLVTGGRNIRHLSAAGVKLAGRTLPEDILTPPVVDDDGALYLGTANNLFRFG